MPVQEDCKSAIFAGYVNDVFPYEEGKSANYSEYVFAAEAGKPRDGLHDRQTAYSINTSNL
jgi:hypothetical protein